MNKMGKESQINHINDVVIHTHTYQVAGAIIVQEYITCI